VKLPKGTGGVKVVTSNATSTVSSPGMTANAEVTRRKDETRIAVRLGRADVAVGERVIAVGTGQVLIVRDDGEIVGPSRIGGARLFAEEGDNTRIYYDRSLGGVGFKWDGGGGVIEIARSESFAEPLVREPVAGGSFTLSGAAGSYYWRVLRGGSPGPVGRVRLGRDPSYGRGSGSVRNRVRDTGVATRILFQGSHPTLTLSWKAVEGAAKYKVRIYRSANLDSPLVSQTVTKTSMALTAGRLKEGTYFWYQAALAADGKELSTGQMNKLSLTFDNHAPVLRVDAAKGGKVAGVAARGSGVTINGRSLQVGPDGRFSQAVSADRGLFIFRIKKSNGAIYFVRHAK
jgi:hypothetical protein